MFDAVRRFLAEPSAQEQRSILEQIQRWGGERRAHCGMVRAIFTQHAGMSWKELETRLSSN